ncbi:MAG: Gfo/Idh/MocA family oxidoreductase [Chloroflexi bacterium]|nr:Gfo/Idh/MocA family oxidoreductase [Chloroflexota bacterium]
MSTPASNAAAPLQVGVVGLGKMGLLHAAIFNSLPGSRVVAAAEPARLPREALSMFNPAIRMFPSLEEMLDGAALHAVVIATPVADHVPSAQLCVERGVPFLMEKPLATSAAQADGLIEALAARKLPHMVGFMTRFVDSFAKGKEIIDSNCLGRLQRVTGTIQVSQLFRRGRGWRYDRVVAGGGVLLSQGSHLLDLLTWYCGPVARVNGEALAVYSPDIEDFAHVMLEFRSGLRGWLDSSWSVRFKRTVETTLDVLGDNGALVVTDDSVRLFLDQAAGGWPEGRTALRATDLYRGVPVDVGGPQYTREDQVFLRALRNHTPAEPAVQQALHVQRIVDAAYASSRERGAPQEIAP